MERVFRDVKKNAVHFNVKLSSLFCFFFFFFSFFPQNDFLSLIRQRFETFRACDGPCIRREIEPSCNALIQEWKCAKRCGVRPGSLPPLSVVLQLGAYTCSGGCASHLSWISTCQRLSAGFIAQAAPHG